MKESSVSSAFMCYTKIALFKLKRGSLLIFFESIRHEFLYSIKTTNEQLTRQKT